MEANELKALLEEVGKANGLSIKEAVRTEVQAATQGLMTADVLGQKLEAAGIKPDTIKTLTEAVEKQGLEMRKLFEGPKSNKTMEEVIEEKAEDIAKLAKGGTNVKITLPSTRKTEVTRAGVQSTTMAMRLAEVGQTPYLGTVMSSLFTHAQVSPSSNGVIRYYDQNTVTRNAAFTAESAVKPESAINWIERTLLIEKLADSIPVTKEAWKDVYFIQSEINRLLNVNLALAEDNALWDGDGNTPNIKGVYTSAYTFDYVGDAVATANLYDLIAAMKVDISNNRQSKYAPNTVIINPQDAFYLKTIKNANGDYIFPYWAMGTSTIDGMRVVESSQVTQNTCLVGDFRFGTIYDLEGVTIEMGWINDQFVQNAMTILAEKRMALLIRNIDQYAFVKCTDIDAGVLQVKNGAS